MAPKRSREPEVQCAEKAEEMVAGTGHVILPTTSTVRPTEVAQKSDSEPAFADQLSKYARKKNPTLLQRIEAIIMKANEPLSHLAIVKECSLEGFEDEAKVRKAIKKALDSGALLRSNISKAKCWLAGGFPEPAPKEAIGVSIQDDFPGTGEGVQAGDEVSINYELFLAADETKLVEKGKKFAFTQGEGHVIKGMDAGVLGLRFGVVRRVTVPWQLGYGRRGSAPDIPPCADLLFVIIRQK
jgi:FKBP-type peptidyl-prolyl cis-trans isomerase